MVKWYEKRGMFLEKNIFISFLLVFILLMSACSNSNEESASDENKILELEEKIEELNNIISKQDNTIDELEKNLKSEQIKTVSNAQGNSKDSIPVLKLGETYSDDKIDVTISQIEYTTSPNKGVQVYFEVVNKSENPLELPGRLTFALEDPKFEEEFNKIGHSINFSPHGYIYQDEGRKGSYQYIYDREINITEITYHAHGSDYSNQRTIATWVID